MTTRTLTHAASLGALIAFMALPPILPAPAADGPQKVVAVKVAAGEGTSRFIPLGVGKSVAIDLPADIKDVLVAAPKIANAVVRSSRRGFGKPAPTDPPADIRAVLVADPKIANAVVRSSRRVYMIGVAVGQTNIFFFDADGKQIAGFDIAVTRDLNGVRAALKQSMPDSDIHIEGVGADGVMLSGTAASAAESQHAFEMAARLVGGE